MNIVTDEKLISRNAKISNIVHILGLAFLAVATYIAFQHVELLFYSLVLMILGFLLSQISIYMGKRWAQRPRPDEYIDKALKGLDKSYTLYHYTTPVPHLLVGPAGVLLLHPNNSPGTITFDEKRGRYRQIGGNVLLKFLAQEGLGRPQVEVSDELKGLDRFLAKRWESDTLVEVEPLLIFTDDRAEVQVEDAPMLTVHANKLKDFIRKRAKEQSVPLGLTEQLNSLLQNKK